ncbi:hypothetical protein [Ectobacillus sp. sgz5001026]
MPLIDFKKFPRGNGADDGKDLIVVECRKGILVESKIRWLVS